nr:hypothetical protein [Tanacetum cinerariifolium]
QIAVLKRDISYKDSEISVLKRSQIHDNSKKGLGYESYHAVPPPLTGPKSCEIKSKNANEDIPNELKEYPDALLVKDRVSDNKDCSVESPVMVERKTIVPTITKGEVVSPKQQEKPVRKTVRYAKMYRS